MSEGAPSGKKKLRHELRTPLNQIIGYSELLTEEAQDAGHDSYVPDLQKIGVAARGLLRVVDQLVDGADLAPPTNALTPEHILHADEEPPLRSEAFGTGRHVLVVDDDARNVDFLARQLLRRGFEVSVASSGQEALELIGVRRFDLVLLDVMMPGMSGLEVLRHLRQHTSAAELPVVMATALDQSDDVVEALKLGANDYVTKPLDLPVVLARLENQLDLKRAREQVEQLARELEARNRLIRSAFGRFMSEEVVRTLLETPEGLGIGGTRRVVTILMSDLRGFTALCDRLEPDEVMALLNEYLGAMVDVVDQHKGTIIEFIGDAVLVLFGAPLSRADDARRALACAIAMQRAMVPINAQLAERGFAALQMGVALNTGEVIVGNIGSVKRSKYGVVGRHVNLAARIESFCVGGQVLASAATVAAAGTGVVTGARTTFNAKGFAEKIDVLDVHGLRDEALFVPTVEAPLVALPAPLAARLTEMVGKVLAETEHEAALTQVSPTGALLRTGVHLPALCDVRLRLHGVDEDVYAKVLGGEGDQTRVRFTSVPPRSLALLASLVSPS